MIYFLISNRLLMRKKNLLGKIINELKSKAETKIQELRNAFENASDNTSVYNDLTRPAEPISLGSRHPISLVKKSDY